MSAKVVFGTPPKWFEIERAWDKEINIIGYIKAY
jgi:hypothetical protein